MLGFLYRFFIGHFKGCEHKWQDKNRIRDFSYSDGDRPSAYIYVLQCEKCGDIKKVKT